MAQFESIHFRFEDGSGSSCTLLVSIRRSVSSHISLPASSFVVIHFDTWLCTCTCSVLLLFLFLIAADEGTGQG